MSTTAIVTLVVRYGLVMLFLPFSALDKILGFRQRREAGGGGIQAAGHRHYGAHVRAWRSR